MEMNFWNKRFILPIIFFFLILGSEFTYSYVNLSINTIEVSGLHSISNEELLYLLDLEKGNILDREALSRGIKRAFLKGIFDDIQIQMDVTDLEGANIRVIVKEKPIISSIKIKGNNYLSEKDIKKQSAIKKGERLNLLKINHSLSAIERFMKEKGFVSPSVSYDLIKEDNSVDVIFNVSEGEPVIIKQIRIHKHEDIILSFLRLSEGEIFDSLEMERLSKRLKEYFRKQGYIHTNLKYDFKNGVLDIKLDAGKRVNISFDGNKALSSKILIKQVPFFDIGDYSDELLEETVTKILMLYHTDGYPFAQIAPSVSVTDESISIQFFIYEGQRYTVDSIEFKEPPDDSISLSEDRLKEVLFLKAGGYYNPDHLDSDRSNIEEFYRALGYIDAKVEKPEVEIFDNVVKIRFLINKGKKITISGIALKGNTHISDEEILSQIPLKIGDPYNEIDISDSRRRILQLYGDMGFLDVRVSISKEILDTSAYLAFEIIEGDVTRFGKAIIRGNDKTKYKIIKRELLLEESKPLNYSTLFKERHKIYRLGLFKDVDVELLDKVQQKRDVLYSLEEANAGIVEFGIGYGEYERLRGFFDISYKNLWGMNKYVSFKTEFSTLEQRFMLSYQEPLFLGIDDLIFKGLILYEYRKERNIDTDEIRYRIKRSAASMGVEKRLSKSLQLESYYDFSVTKTSDVQPDVILSREDTGTLIISGLRAGLLYDIRDNPFNPTKGLLAGASLKFASSVFLSETEFAKIVLYANHYYSLSKRIVLATSLRGGAAEGFGVTKELPLVERFFLGGRNTVRGYDQDTLGPKGKDGIPTGGNSFLMANLELRIDAGRGVGIVAFVDGGNVWRLIQDIDITGIKFTAGIGLRYNTPVGPFRLDYGHKLQREPGESKGALHFSIGHAF